MNQAALDASKKFIEEGAEKSGIVETFRMSGGEGG